MGGHEDDDELTAEEFDQRLEQGEPVEESEVTPDETYDAEGTVDALTIEQLDKLEQAGYDEDADQAITAAAEQASDE